ncbi:site-specific integrase [Dysgonomonas sp. 511]|uniref:site-specific integrase n=1 Tax=Dysgonomonas sp. 511 TaxID=2302930 RepID=UPI0013D1C15E|nr:site-specific integrase [Dysgonomonas sp. 511]NDV79953.1 site-specific integrase [Dysgonomonas sp. 511]
MTEVKVSFYLKRNEEKQDGTVPVLGRIRIGKSMVQFSAKVSVPVSLWDTKSGRASGKSKTALSINASLNKICVAIHSAYRDLLAKKENVSAQDVKNAFQGIASEQDTLVKYYESHNEHFLKCVGVNRCMETYKRYGISLNHLKRFMRKKYNVSDISFQALTPSFVADYDYYLRVELRFAPQTIVNTIGQLRRIVKIAINNGLLRNDPFIDYEFITSPIAPKSLTSAELKKLVKAKLSRPNLNFIRDMFLFSSFTGIAFSDMRSLTEQNLSIAEDGVRWVDLKRKKTGTPCHIPLLEIPLQLIEKYRGLAKEGKLFPMISCSKTNIYLKRIATECGIDKRVTFHMARHCYASVVTLSQGVPLETVAELLGHRDWRATRIYAQVSNEKIGEDMRHLNKRLSGKFHLVDNNVVKV